MDINKVQLMGNVGQDPEIKYHDDKKFAKFSMATSFKFKDKEYTEWHNIVCFDEKLAEIIEKYVQKGTRIQVFGQLRTRKYDKEGQTHYITEVIIPKFKGELILISRAKDSGEFEPAGQPQQSSMDDGFDDEIPF